jgi:hypothetical protein
MYPSYSDSGGWGGGLMEYSSSSSCQSIKLMGRVQGVVEGGGDPAAEDFEMWEG